MGVFLGSWDFEDGGRWFGVLVGASFVPLAVSPSVKAVLVNAASFIHVDDESCGVLSGPVVKGCVLSFCIPLEETLVKGWTTFSETVRVEYKSDMLSS